MAHAVTDPDDATTEALVVVADSTTEQTGADTTDEIARLRSEIALRRQRLDTALHQLEHRVSEDLDWRRRVGAHPWLLLAAAALAGYALGRLTGGEQPSDHRLREVESS
jgi:hypothetical protein